MSLVALTAPVPIILGTPVTRIWAYTGLRIVSIGANLRALITGPFTIEIRQAGDGSPLIKTFTFNNTVPQATEPNEVDFTIPTDMGVRIDVTALGVGAADCLVTIWGFVQ